MSQYPVHIQQFHDTLLRLKGMTQVDSGVDNLEPIEADMLRVQRVRPSYEDITDKVPER